MALYKFRIIIITFLDHSVIVSHRHECHHRVSICEHLDVATESHFIPRHLFMSASASVRRSLLQADYTLPSERRDRLWSFRQQRRGVDVTRTRLSWNACSSSHF